MPGTGGILITQYQVQGISWLRIARYRGYLGYTGPGTGARGYIRGRVWYSGIWLTKCQVHWVSGLHSTRHRGYLGYTVPGAGVFELHRARYMGYLG